MDLIQQLAMLTRLPQDTVTKELYRVANNKGYDITNINMNDLRAIMSCYLEEVLSGFSEEEDIKASQI